MSWFVNEVSAWRPLMLRPFLTLPQEPDRSPTYAASINKSVGYRSRRRSPSHGRVVQDQPPYSLQYESRNIRNALHCGKAAWWFAHPTPLHYRRPSKCPCVIRLFPPLQNTALSHSLSGVAVNRRGPNLLCFIQTRRRILPILYIITL